MRQSALAIMAKREKKNAKILLTGATGFVGSYLAVELLKRGYPVILLCRPSQDLSASERVSQLMRWFQVDAHQMAQLEVIEGFIEQPHLGLTDEGYAYILRNTDEVFHCAASVSFSEKKREQIEAANVEGVQNMVGMAAASSCFFFHYISTVYMAGKKTGYCPEEFVETEHFNNVYEETKYKGEKLALEGCNRAGIKLNIYRPSIIYGDSESGKANQFRTLYYPMKMIQYVRDTFLLDIRENQGKNTEELGFRVDDNGTMYCSVRIKKNEKGRLNVIPINYFIDACMAIMDESLDGGIFQIVSQTPQSLDDLIEYGQRFFNINGIRAVDEEDFDIAPPNPVEALVNSRLDIYDPYMRDTRIFGSENTKDILGKRNITCPDLDYEVFERCMKYAIEVDWGNNIFEAI
jgi:nucleoside-diphosphate-sugar epimerase